MKRVLAVVAAFAFSCVVFEGTVMMAADSGHPPAQHAQMHSGGHHSGNATASDPVFRIGDIAVAGPWLRATPAGAKVGGGYMKITNNGKTVDRLIGGSIDLARRFEVHEMAVKDGIMTMRPLDDGIEIKPGQTVELQPGGFHVMAMDLAGRYEAASRIKGTLRFEKAGTLEVEYVVLPIGATKH